MQKEFSLENKIIFIYKDCVRNYLTIIKKIIVLIL